MATKRVRIKICGITNPDDAAIAVAGGADAIGLVFYEQSARYVTIEQARKITDNLPPFISRVALFVNASADYIHDVIGNVGIDILQFHGDESDADCSRYEKSYIKAIRMRKNVDLVLECERYKGTSALLLDSFDESQYGGTGRTFNWSVVPGDIAKPVILAGGLTADNVKEAINRVHPYAVDVNGGVEISKGKKDADKIYAFTDEVLNAYD